jgi:hypothetical protein
MVIQIVAKVKSVVSGDTLILKSTKSGAEKTLSLAYVSAPRLHREGDEVWNPPLCCSMLVLSFSLTESKL